MSEESFQQFQDYLKLQNPKVIANTKEISAEKLGQSFMLHIDKVTPKTFMPRIGESFSSDEDRTLPRITVSDNLLGCIIGYYRFLKDFFEVESEKSNGYCINIIPFEYCLKPNSKLVPYGEDANEYWLITYNEETKKYAPESIGKIFVSEISQKLNDRKGRHIVNCTFYVEINTDVGIPFTKDKILKEGTYKIKGDLSDYNSDNDDDGSDNINHKDLELFKITKIPKEAYINVKKLSAVTLSETPSINSPLFTKW